MVQSSMSLRLGFGAVVLASVALASQLAYAKEPKSRPGDDRRPVYQRRAYEWSPWHGNRHHHAHHDFHYFAPRISAGWFQRPYPYHLDYYRMKYGSSYAPYFGNLYGPPQVVTAPPYYGPYYGGYGEPGAHGYQGANNVGPFSQGDPGEMMHQAPDHAANETTQPPTP